jgi:tripartite-type tricarboxylate transporter receptor subunit TctC
MKQRRFLLLGTALAMAGAFALPTLALAQGAYPNRPIKFVVP